MTTARPAGPVPALPATLYLARHGQTVWHRENRYAGTTDVDLTPTGHRQAELLARWAEQERPDALYCSPVRRAIQTAEPAAAASGLTPIVVPDLREVHFGIAEGQTIGELRAGTPEVVARFETDPIDGHFPEAEPPLEAARRGSDALRWIAGRHPGGSVLVVAHNTLIRLCLCELLGIPLARYRMSLPELSNGTLTTIRLGPTAGAPASLLSFNVPLLPALLPT